MYLVQFVEFLTQALTDGKEHRFMLRDNLLGLLGFLVRGRYILPLHFPSNR